MEVAWKDGQEARHEFWKTIDENVKAEFINGIGVYDSPVYGRNWKANSRICRYLIPHVMDNELGEVGYEKVMIRCYRNDYEPDICFWRKEVSDQFQEKQSAFPPPHFVVEILSDSTKGRDRGIKFEDYALHGVEEYWIVDTDNNCIEQYFLNGKTFKLHIKAFLGVLVSKAVTGFEMIVLDTFK